MSRRAARPPLRSAWRLTPPRAAVLLVLATIGAVLVDRSRSGLWDLSVYRMGGHALLDRLPLYQQRSAVAGLSFTYPPFAALLFVPAALVPSWAAGALWTAVSLLALARVCWLIAGRLSFVAGPLVGAGTVAVATVLLAVALLTEPVTETLRFGQVNLLLMWLVVEDLVGRWPVRARGTLVGLAASVKLTPSLLLGYLLARGTPRDALRGMAVVVATVLLGFLLAPGDSWAYWTRLVLDRHRVGSSSSSRNQSLYGLLDRATGQPPGLLWLAVAAAVAVAGLAIGAVAARRGEQLLGLTVAAVTGLLVSPVSWSHHWVWVLPVAALAAADGPLRPVTRVVAGLLLLAAVTRVIWWLPWHDGAEFTSGLVGFLLRDAYVLPALVWLALVGRDLVRPAARVGRRVVPVRRTA